jgi:hypothetical protein
MSEVAIRIVGVDVSDYKLYYVLVQNIGNSDLPVGRNEDWAVCIKRADGSIVSPSVNSLSFYSTTYVDSLKLYPNRVLRIYVDPTPLHLHSGPVKITVSGPKGVSASYTIEL